VNPYTAPSPVPQEPTGVPSLLDALWLPLATLGVSMLTCTVFGSLVWDGTISILPLRDRAHLITLVVSVGLAVGACLSQIAERVSRSRYASTATYSIVVATSIAYFCWTSWPIASYYVYIDLSKVFAVYTGIAFVPTLVLFAAVFRARAAWISLGAFVALGILALYVGLQ
jgi:hypothetical protein